MDWPRSCRVVIPCFNEAGTIGPLVAAVRRRLPQVLVVDDGSSDGTARVAQAAGSRVSRLATNGGKGAALRAGLARTLEDGFPWALMLDGDGQHDPADIPRFLAEAESSGARLIVGNRMGDPAGMPWLRHKVNHWMSRRLSQRAGINLPDTQCGFRLLDLGLLEKLSLGADHFEIESEMLLSALDQGALVRFVAIRTIGRGPKSRIHPMRDSIRWFRWWLRTATPPGQKRNTSSAPATQGAS